MDFKIVFFPQLENMDGIKASSVQLVRSSVFGCKLQQ